MNNAKRILSSIWGKSPDASAYVRGGREYPALEGTVLFFSIDGKVAVCADFEGLPIPRDKCGNTFHGFHIHSGGSCRGSGADEFGASGSHYNPGDCPHPSHAGDLPPLLSCRGRAFSLFLTDRFTLDEIIGLTVIVHLNADDFTTQPSGNSGDKIACGVIRRAK